MKILLVEDEEQIREALKLNLELEHYEVIPAINGRLALKSFEAQHFDLVILDIMMPEMDGLMVCEQIRLLNREIPILFLTAKHTPEDRIKGLKKGADDYLSKPFLLEELLLRIKNLLKRNVNAPQLIDADVFQLGNYTIHFNTFQAIAPSNTIQLTKKETMLLKLLIERKNQVVTRQQILQVVWGYDVYPSTRTIDNFILSFRKYFEPDPKQPKSFLSVRGVGYKFVEPYL
jgi:two-component system, OmpR family, alkaline phosphatase synthesis response regulator PhoP